METNRLRHFHAVFKTGSLRKASETLRLSPSALSKSIHSLQDSLGVELFTHTGKSLVLTKAGQTLAHRIAPILSELDELAIELRSDSDLAKNRPLRIATFEVFSTYFLSGLDTIDFGERNLYLYEGEPGQIEAAVAEGRADLGITYIPQPYQSCDHIKVTRIEMGVFVRKGAFRSLPQIELPYVVPICPLMGTPTKVKGLDGWPDHAYERNIRYRVTLLESALELCRQGKAAGYFPAFIVELHNQKYKESYHLERKRYDMSGNICYCDVFIVKRKDSSEDQDIRNIAKMIRRVTSM